MGKLIQFPCVDHYDVWDCEYEEYYEKENYYLDDDKRNGFKGFIRRLLLFVLSRL